MILHKIVKHKEKELSIRKANIPIDILVERCSSKLFEAKSGLTGFKEAISRTGSVNIIAEIKGRSPSRGIIKENFDPCEVASIYEQNGAAALSILTDEKFFGGSLEHLLQIRRNVSLPILRKDFIIDEYQIYEAALSGAKAVLLIVRILTDHQLKKFLHLTSFLNMDALIEINCEDDLQRALDGGAEIIGINNRDLATFTVNLEATLRLAPKVPSDRIIVSESGVTSSEDVKRLVASGVHSILIGTVLMEAKEPAKKIRELLLS